MVWVEGLPERKSKRRPVADREEKAKKDENRPKTKKPKVGRAEEQVCHELSCSYTIEETRMTCNQVRRHQGEDGNVLTTLHYLLMDRRWNSHVILLARRGPETDENGSRQLLNV